MISPARVIALEIRKELLECDRLEGGADGLFVFDGQGTL